MGLSTPEELHRFAQQPVKAELEWLDEDGRTVATRDEASMARLKKLYRGITTIVVDAADADAYLSSDRPTE
jgi:hypothetical protein